MSKCLFLFFVFMPMAVFSNEQMDAEKACERVMELVVKENKKNGINDLDYGNICQINTRSKNYWECIENKMLDGNSFSYSSNRCVE